MGGKTQSVVERYACVAQIGLKMAAMLIDSVFLLEYLAMKSKYGASMFRLSGDFIYTLAGQLRPVDALTHESSRFEIYLVVKNAAEGLNGLYIDNALGLRASWNKGLKLQDICTSVIETINTESEKILEPLDLEVLNNLKIAFTTFEITFKAELSVANLYVLTPKGAYDTNILAEYGARAFPESLESKVPEAFVDANQAARCLAFDLATAAAFHLHRAHEAVVHAYFKSIAPKAQAPDRQPLGVWIEALETHGAPKDVVAAIKDIIRLHRNPVLHPENSLTESEEAIALLGSINTSMRYMLKNIKPPAELSVME